jgi:hypothetical protein
MQRRCHHPLRSRCDPQLSVGCRHQWNGGPVRRKSCTDLFTTLGGTPDAGGSWTDPGGGSHPGQFDPATDVAGVYTYTLTNAVPPCTATSTVTVSFTDQPDAGADAILSLCSTGVTVNLLTALNGTPEPGGTWLDPSGAVFTGPFDPSSDVPGAYTYTIAAVAPCVSASATVTITIASAANAGSDATLTICSTDAPVTLVDALGGSRPWADPGQHLAAHHSRIRSTLPRTPQGSTPTPFPAPHHVRPTRPRSPLL